MPTFTEMFSKEFEWEMKKTRQLLEAIPDHDPDFRPHEKSMPLGRLAGHVADLPNWMTLTIEQDSLDLAANYKIPPLEKGGREAMLAHFDKCAASARAALAATNDDHLNKNWKLLFKDHVVVDLPRTTVLTAVCKNHLIHHRGQLTVYIRMLDGKVPGLYGPSADDNAAPPS